MIGSQKDIDEIKKYLSEITEAVNQHKVDLIRAIADQKIALTEKMSNLNCQVNTTKIEDNRREVLRIKKQQSKVLYAIVILVLGGLVKMFVFN